MVRKIRGTLATASLVAAFGFAVGCGSEDDPETTPDPDPSTADDAGTGGDGDDTATVTYTLVPILDVDASNPVVTPHKVIVLDAESGKKLSEGTTEKGTGTITLEDLPRDKVINIHVIGVGPADVPESTYDTVILNLNVDSGDPLLRISNAGSFELTELTAGFTAKDDRASVAMGVYWSPGGVRTGNISCAKLCFDGAKEPSEDMDQRYVSPNGVPTRLSSASETNATGRAYLGNATVGAHNVGVSFDDCKTFVHKVDFFVPFARKDAKSPLKSVVMQLGIDIDTKDNPTPEDCKVE